MISIRLYRWFENFEVIKLVKQSKRSNADKVTSVSVGGFVATFFKIFCADFCEDFFFDLKISFGIFFRFPPEISWFLFYFVISVKIGETFVVICQTLHPSRCVLVFASFSLSNDQTKFGKLRQINSFKWSTASRLTASMKTPNGISERELIASGWSVENCLHSFIFVEVRCLLTDFNLKLSICKRFLVQILFQILVKFFFENNRCFKHLRIMTHIAVMLKKSYF